MSQVAPSGPVYQAGTLSGNPVAMAAGHANLDLITADGFYDDITEKAQRLMAGFKSAADSAKVPLATIAVGGMFGFFFTQVERVSSFEQASSCNLDAFKRFFHAMLENGVYLAPSAYEAGFISQAHTDDDIQNTIDAAAKSFAQL